jgi:2-methylfumaryl-CoA hydratase
MAAIKKHKGNFLEDFRAGQTFRHKVGKTVTEGLFNAFTEYDMTTNPLHKNRRYAELYGFAGLVVPPGLVMNVVFSQSVEDISENARANLEYINMRFGAPVYIGDTLEVASTVLGVKPSRREPDRGVVHVQTTGRNQKQEVVLTYERKVQVWKRDPKAEVLDEALDAIPPIPCDPQLPEYDARRGYTELAHLTSNDTYFENFVPGDIIEHSRGRVVTAEHVALTATLDNTSQVHCNQYLIDLQPGKYLGGQLVVYGGIPFNLCLGLSCPDVADNALGDIIYPSGRHTAPVFAGDTVFATTEIRSTREYPGRPDLGVVATTLRGHKFVRKDSKFEKIEIFYLEREIAVKRHRYYCPT